MKNVKRKILILFSCCAFAVLMMFNINVSSSNNVDAGSCITLSGMEALAVSTQEDDCRTCVKDLSQVCTRYSEWTIGMRNNSC